MLALNQEDEVYRQKYLKYKTKYLELKELEEQEGGKVLWFGQNIIFVKKSDSKSDSLSIILKKADEQNNYEFSKEKGRPRFNMSEMRKNHIDDLWYWEKKTKCIHKDNTVYNRVKKSSTAAYNSTKKAVKNATKKQGEDSDEEESNNDQSDHKKCVEINNIPKEPLEENKSTTPFIQAALKELGDEWYGIVIKANGSNITGTASQFEILEIVKA